jgi:3-oxoacyl-[acyl-carrier protein] reductase
MSRPVAIVTGGGRGIGKGIALQLAAAGYDVALYHLDEPDLAQGTVTDLTQLGVDAVAIQGDVRVRQQVEALIDTVAARFGRISLLVNNAGIQTWQALLDVSDEEWDAVIDTNLKGTFLCTQLAARHMKDHGGGCIVNIGSGCNKIPFPKLVAYTASKGGIEMLTKVAALELGPLGIRVNCVAPGAIEVERTRLESPDYAESWSRVTPLRRVGTPADVGQAVVYLASDAAAFVTGQTLWLDGGLFSQGRWAYEET